MKFFVASYLCACHVGWVSFDSFFVFMQFLCTSSLFIGRGHWAMIQGWKRCVWARKFHVHKLMTSLGIRLRTVFVVCCFPNVSFSQYFPFLTWFRSSSFPSAAYLSPGWIPSHVSSLPSDCSLFSTLCLKNQWCHSVNFPSSCCPDWEFQFFCTTLP